ncbi:hypothetical protein Tco_1401845 [Tanacetum coccineum]
MVYLRHVPSKKVFLRLGKPEDRQRNQRHTNRAGKKNVPTFTKTSSAMPVGVEIVRSTSSSIMSRLVKIRYVGLESLIANIGLTSLVISLGHRRLDVFGAWLHRILCHIGFIFHLFRKRRNLRSIIGNTASGSDCFTSPSGSNGVAWKRPKPELSKSDLDTPGAGGAGAGAWRKTGRSNLIRNHRSSATSDETAGVEELVLTLETMALLRD